MRPKWYILNEHGELVRVDVLTYEKWASRHHPCNVARTDLPNGITVSTIFLGLDHAIPGIDPEPELLFETMAYDRVPGQSFYDEQWRYPDWPAAATGHQAACAYFAGFPRRRFQH